MPAEILNFRFSGHLYRVLGHGLAFIAKYACWVYMRQMDDNILAQGNFTKIPKSRMRRFGIP